MKASELRELSDDELLQKGQELLEELFNLRFQLATNQIENVGRLSAVRRDIARVKTIQRERQDKVYSSANKDAGYGRASQENSAWRGCQRPHAEIYYCQSSAPCTPSNI